MEDKTAKKVLFDTYWQNGWIAHDKIQTPPEQFEYAKSKGYMFDPFWTSHDVLISNLLQQRDSLNRREVSNGFLASLSSRRLNIRSALGSYAFALNFPNHKLDIENSEMLPSGARRCKLCGFFEQDRPGSIDLNVLNFERHKWGGVRYNDPTYAWLDLSLSLIHI